MVFDNLLFYMKFPSSLSAQLPVGKRWVRFDLAKLGKEQGIDFQQLLQLGSADPSQALQLLQAASPDFHEVGREEVRGTPTTHYAGTVDFSKLAISGPPVLRQSYRRIIELSGQGELPVDVWIDEDGLTRRIRYVQDLPGGATMEQTQDYYDFGVDVNVEPPPANEVLDITQLLGNA
jgi:hypothetical protein